MNNNGLIAVIIVVLLVVLGVAFLQSVRNSNTSSLNGAALNNNQQGPLTSSTDNGSSNNGTSNNNGQGTNASSSTVTYTNNGFSPSSVTIRKGGTVKFVNNSSAGMRPASNPHPQHDEYPTTGGCVASTFDSCTTIASGSSWSFKFDVTGSWDYHNHLNPSMGGTVVVQ
jgi:plastocyanin